MSANTDRVPREASQSHELWKLLIESGGLAPGDYDALIVDDLRRHLGLPPDLPLLEALERYRPSTNSFVEAFFKSAQPYIRMWTELLSMYERAAARQGAENLRIRYDFGKSSGLDHLEFDLAFFRQVLRVVELMMSPFDLSSATPREFWGITEAFRSNDHSFQIDPQEELHSFREFVAQCRMGSYPERIPPLPALTDSRAAGLLQEAWTLADVVREELRVHFGSYRGVDQAWQVDDERLSYGLSKRVLRFTEHDHWLPTFVSSVLTKLADRESHDWSLIGDQLDLALGKVRNLDTYGRTPRERLEEFLQLPLWKMRSDLYSHWVCASVIRALDDQEPIVHSMDGTLVFSFSGTHLATFDGLSPRIHLWTELRTPLENPVGEGRTGNIQPDIVLRRDPLSAGLNPVVVECKQYKRANNKSFGAALTDYAHGHPDALVLLADYGPVNPDSVLKYVPEDVQEHTNVVPQLHPANVVSVTLFHSLIRGKLRLEPLPPVTKSPAGRVELRWGQTPRDLDLHLLVQDPVHHVYYGEQGTLDTEPFACLMNDDTSGQGHEVLKIERWWPTYYRVEVHNFSQDAPLAVSSAVVVLELAGKRYEYSCPEGLIGEIWEVCVIDGRTAEVVPQQSMT